MKFLLKYVAFLLVAFVLIIALIKAIRSFGEKECFDPYCAEEQANLKALESAPANEKLLRDRKHEISPIHCQEDQLLGNKFWIEHDYVIHELNHFEGGWFRAYKLHPVQSAEIPLKIKTELKCQYPTARPGHSRAMEVYYFQDRPPVGDGVVRIKMPEYYFAIYPNKLIGEVGSKPIYYKASEALGVSREFFDGVKSRGTGPWAEVVK